MTKVPSGKISAGCLPPSLYWSLEFVSEYIVCGQGVPPATTATKKGNFGRHARGSKHAINKAWRPRAPVCAPRFLVTPSSSLYPLLPFLVFRYGRRRIGLSGEVCPSEVGAARYAFPRHVYRRSSDQAPVVCIASAVQRQYCAMQAVVGRGVLTA